MTSNIVWFDDIRMADVPRVGGKNASLGELINNLTTLGIRVPQGFATTADAYRAFLDDNQLTNRLSHVLTTLDIDDVLALAKAGKQIREWILQADFSPVFIADITQAYQKLAQQTDGECDVAVRSSATAEDLPDASFAGQQETLLNVRGVDAVLLAIKTIIASLFTDRAIAYRVHQGFDHLAVSLSVGVQRMVRSDRGVSGVLFTLDTESGFKDVVFINAAYGLGEAVVQGSVNPDEYVVHKPHVVSRKVSHLAAKFRFEGD